ncbi:uncharacterized protein [Anabrus simplex]|uniref:uncharacterized protein n=1 Tax=Anabrus simplex TaxID=316456 RepID=UPI0035A27A74
MIVSGTSNLSEESEDEVDNFETEIRDKYSKKYKLLLERCEILQQDNERLVHRIQQVRKILHRARRERKFLMDRLDLHGDNWRNIPFPLELDEPLGVSTAIAKPEKLHLQKNVERTPSGKTIEKSSRKSTPSSTCSSASKRKNAKSGEKGERDPNAPKRPANPFFQFCQEQRPLVMEQKVGEAETSKQELTRQLASKWNTLPPEDKKVYYDMYEKSKEKYAAEMQVYSSRAKIPGD